MSWLRNDEGLNQVRGNQDCGGGEIADKSLGGKIIRPEDWLDFRNKGQVFRLLLLLIE